MSFKHILILLKKEFALGSKSFIFIWVLIVPILLSIIMSFLFGTFFLRSPKLGLYLESPSKVLASAESTKAFITIKYNSAEDLKNAVSNGRVDVGVVIPENFDENVKKGIETSLTSYIFGESYAKNRAIIATAFGNIIREIAGQELPIKVISLNVGDETSMPIKDRFFPFIVLVAIFMGGLFIPSSSFIEEKRKKTLDALRATPLVVSEVVISKILTGAIVALVAGIFTLLLNNAFGNYPLHLLLVMTLGVLMASFIGAMLGFYLNDFAMLLSVLKIGGIVLFFPAFVYLFPQIPEIVAKFFPTYYALEPIVELTKGSVNFSSFWVNTAICIILDIILGIAVLLQVKKFERGEAIF